MMTRACLVLLAGAALGGCEPASLPQPSLVAVEPPELRQGESVELRLRIDALLSGTMDYGNRTVSDSQLEVWVGERRLDILRYERGGLLVVRAPADLDVGTHDVRLVLSGEREARLVGGLTVSQVRETLDPHPVDPHPVDPRGPGTQEQPPGAGPGEEHFGLSGFRMEPLRAQMRGVPFTLELRAEGSQALAFRGTVALSVSHGSIQPAVAGPFVDGVARVQVTVDQPAAKVVITAVDAHGNQGRSNEFQVWPN